MHLSIQHTTHYRFNRPVLLLPHRLLVTPRGGNELRLIELTIDAGPGVTIDWTDDVFANRVATISFGDPRADLALAITMTVEQDAPAFPIFTIAVDAHSYPFAYSEDDRIDLGALAVASADADAVATWARGFVASDPLALLKDLNAGITPVVAYRVRDEEGTQSPAETLAIGSGSCRDIAALFIEAARHLGFGARAVSGYLHDPEQRPDDPGSTHAWAEVYLPGAGWITFDPTHQRVGDAHLIPVAVARHNGQIMPVTGGYLGAPEDAAGMEVSVRVSAA
ncbi:transglutaminase family protein [Sphingomonas montanisoli]|uniref:Transglutaminase family protein n=1 Tax=Sphingomonas montanisoli TaxID=2606412 RepID=A0A5D9C7I2_9SPHN|nr:transglutaminase family protein [Sphingomonas montanisoli]TZG27649.1 transglutaminase family protein [Sphingomonas montanisoli]